MRFCSRLIVASKIAQDVAERHFDIDPGAKLLGYFCNPMRAHSVREVVRQVLQHSLACCRLGSLIVLSLLSPAQMI
jgi:hypothetical protein